jgi:hypothetical protein
MGAAFSNMCESYLMSPTDSKANLVTLDFCACILDAAISRHTE